MGNNKAFTLVEILVVVVLSSIIILILSHNLMDIIKLRNISENRLSAVYIAQKALEDIEISADKPKEGIYMKDKNITVKYKYEIKEKEYKLNFDSNFENNIHKSRYCRIFITVDSNSGGKTLYKLYSEKRL